MPTKELTSSNPTTTRSPQDYFINSTIIGYCHRKPTCNKAN